MEVDGLQLHRYAENSYRLKPDVLRYPFVTPRVCVSDYRGYPWEETFHLDFNSTADEAYIQLNLSALKVTSLASFRDTGTEG